MTEFSTMERKKLTAVARSAWSVTTVKMGVGTGIEERFGSTVGGNVLCVRSVLMVRKTATKLESIVEVSAEGASVYVAMDF
jgi:hypothetical protein